MRRRKLCSGCSSQRPPDVRLWLGHCVLGAWLSFSSSGSTDLKSLPFDCPGTAIFDPSELEVARSGHFHEERDERICNGSRLQSGSKNLSAPEFGFEGVQQEPHNQGPICV